MVGERSRPWSPFFNSEQTKITWQPGAREPEPKAVRHLFPATQRFGHTAPIRNAHTRAAYYRAIQQFLAWAERAGYQDLEDIEPITVAAYIEILQRQTAPPTVKQRMAAIRMLFSWLTEKGVLAMNPAREVKTERFWLNSNKGTAESAVGLAKCEVLAASPQPAELPRDTLIERLGELRLLAQAPPPAPPTARGYPKKVGKPS